MRNKRGVELSMNVIIIAILVILVLIVVSIFFLGGISNITEKIRDIFGGTVRGTDIPLAVESCKNKCNLAQQTNSESVYCGATFKIDNNADGYADYTTDDNGKRVYEKFYCDVSPINTPCPGIECRR